VPNNRLERTGFAGRSACTFVRQRSESEDWVDWVEQADRFWAGELGVAAHVLRTDGFHVFERVGADAQPRATMVGTSLATVVSLPEGQAHTFENAGLSLEQMRRSPRCYVASCCSIHSLEVRGPAYLAYWPPSSPRPAPRGRIELVGGDGWASLASLRDIAPAEWVEAGIGPDSRVFGLRVDDRIVAVAGYERWSGQIAQLQVFCHPGYRRRRLGSTVCKPVARISEAHHSEDYPARRKGNSVVPPLVEGEVNVW
jgi:hypothetical protein